MHDFHAAGTITLRPAPNPRIQLCGTTQHSDVHPSDQRMRGKLGRATTPGDKPFDVTTRDKLSHPTMTQADNDQLLNQLTTEDL